MISIKLLSSELQEFMYMLNDSSDFMGLPVRSKYELLRGRLGGSVIVVYSSGKVLVNSMNQAISNLFKSVLKDGCSSVGLGSDEAGKGEVVGPIVVSAVLLRSGECIDLRLKGLGDSKSLSMNLIRELGEYIESNILNNTVILSPKDFNDLFERGNLNVLLRDLHVKALSPLLTYAPPRVVVDNFGNLHERYLRDFIKTSSSSSDFIYKTKAEIFPEVAAASVLAKYTYLKWIDEFKSKKGFDPHTRLDASDLSERVKLAYLKK